MIRADIVGSMLRPDYLQSARDAARQGNTPLSSLRDAEDRAVREAVEVQVVAGMDVISDGEMRRWSWIATVPNTEVPFYVPPAAGFSILDAGLGWIRGWRDSSGAAVNRPVRPRPIITERLRPQRDIVAEELGFLHSVARGVTKFTFPAPSYHRVFWHPEFSASAYPSVNDFLEDICAFIKREVVERAIALGCEYVQMDAPNYGQFYTDPDIRAEFEAEGHDLAANLIADALIDDAVFSGVHGAARALHVCRGNGAGGIWSATGGYDVLAPELFARLHNVDRLLLEYDTPRSGDFSPLQHVLPEATVVLGLLTTKSPVLEDTQSVQQRIAEASAYMPLGRLALSPQCGFNSAGSGNPLSADEQRSKLRLVSEIARQVWPV